MFVYRLGKSELPIASGLIMLRFGYLMLRTKSWKALSTLNFNFALVSM